MKNSIRESKKVYLLAIILGLLVISTSMVFGKAIVNEFTFDINQFTEDIQASPDEYWKKPAQNRKNAVYNKLTELQQLITEENFEDAYDKLLYDIKPKLIGLKQDEHGTPWGNGVYNQPWVIYGDLQAIYRDEVDSILSQINPLSVYDDDKTPPTITITYEGGNYLANIGVWDITIEDMESGIDEVLIEINGFAYFHEQNLGGPLSLSYNDIALPFAIGTHMIIVTAINDDMDNEWDQEVGTETNWVEILEDTTAPIIDIVYQGDNNDGNPGIWNVNAYDDESGINLASLQISIDGQFAGIVLGDYDVPNSLMEHSILVEVENNGPNNPLYNSLSQSTTIIDDDDISPIITYSYNGDETDGNSGEIIVSASDNVGLSVDPSGTYPVPNTLGPHYFEFSATDNDNDRDSDSLTTILTVLKVITDDDTIAPIISIIYTGNYFDDDAGYFSWEISDTDDGIGGDNDLGLNGIVIHGTYESTIGLPDEQFLLPFTETGIWNLPTFPGIYRLYITAFDNDDDRTLEVDALSTYLLQGQVILDDDSIWPSISIQYEGEGHITNPGVWHVEIEDLESGLDTVVIKVNEIEEVYDLQGEPSVSYDISVPAIAQINTIEVIATNDDKDYVGDQETSAESDWVEIVVDTSPPVITIAYVGDLHTRNPGVWNVLIEDTQSGIDTVIISVDGNIVIQEPLGGASSVSYSNIAVPATEGVHAIEVIAKDSDQNEIAITDSRTILPPPFDPSAPNIIIGYAGTGHTEDPGEWTVDINDPQSGLDEVQIIIHDAYGNIEYSINDQNLNGIYSKSYNIPLPAIEGVHTIKVTAKNTDLVAYTVWNWIDITQPPDYTGPVIEVLYIGSGTDFDSGWWNIYTNDPESGIDEVLILVNGFEWRHDENLGGITSISYTGETGGVIVPGSVGIHMIEVIAFNNDKDYQGDQESSYYMETVQIVHDPNPPPIIIFPPPSDSSPPTISISYIGAETTEDPGIWNVLIGDVQSGIGTVTITVDGNIVYQNDQVRGLSSISFDGIAVPASEGCHTIEV